MKWLFFHYDTFLEFEQPVREHQFVLRCEPTTNGRQRVVRADVVIKPRVPINILKDGFGNMVQTGCIPFEHTSFHYSSEGEVFVFENNRDETLLNPVFRYPSSLTKASPDMLGFFQGIGVKKGEKACDAAEIVMDAVGKHFEYIPGSTDTSTTAAQAFDKKAGVCQDYTHAFISFMRLAGYPARYANGLLVGEGASHAWAEIYEDGCWIGFDPTRNSQVSDDYLRFCVGRDFDDCSIERGVFFGDSGQRQTVQIKVYEASQVKQGQSRSWS
ncbi:MAG: transglutaminase family protein [Clostridiales bacterium]|nr:transglutaminase family protein [Clostridiales bacterium]